MIVRPQMFDVTSGRRQISIVLLLASCLVFTHLNAAHTDSPKKEPRATTISEDAKAILLSADRIEVVVVTVRDTGGSGLGVEPVETLIGNIPLERLHPWIKKLNLISDPVASSWGSDTIPTLCFTFYKNQKPIAVVNVDYGSSPNTCFREWEKGTSYNFQPESAFSLRKLIAGGTPFPQSVTKSRGYG